MDSKTKRERLTPRREPYWARLRTGGHLGFRKLAEGEGTWVAKYRGDDGARQYKALGTVLSEGKRDAFDIAAKLATEWFDQLDRGITGKGETVADVCQNYVDAIKVDRPKAAADAEGRFNRLVFKSPIGRIELDKLKAADVRKWRDDQVDEEDEDDPDAVRRSKDSANRNLSALKAALNLAYRDQRTPSDHAWRGVSPFAKVGARRTDCLTLKQRKALIDACGESLARLVRAALLTGARPGELAAAKVADFDKKHGTLRVSGKTGARVIPLSTAARELFAECSKDRIAAAALLARPDGAAWDRFTWRDLFAEARTKAKLPPTVVMYSLRHTAITTMLTEGGLDLLTAARITGTSVPMISLHYGHLVMGQTAAALDRVTMV
jgi:integrase